MVDAKQYQSQTKLSKESAYNHINDKDKYQTSKNHVTPYFRCYRLVSEKHSYDSVEDPDDEAAS